MGPNVEKSNGGEGGMTITKGFDWDDEFLIISFVDSLEKQILEYILRSSQLILKMLEVETWPH